MERIERSFAELEYEGKKRKTRREKFLERMEGLIPWEKLLEKIRPYYPPAGKGRVPYPLEGMLRVHCVQLFYNVSDPAMEDMLYEIESVRRFSGIRKEHLAEAGLVLREGTILDASIIASPASRKNRERARDPEMGQTKKGNQWHFGMKLHVGVDDQTGVAHSVVTTAATCMTWCRQRSCCTERKSVSGEMPGIRGLRSVKSIRIGKWPGTLP